MFGELPDKGWNDKIYCTLSDASSSFRTNETHGFLSCYSFTLVIRGWLTFVYQGREMTLRPGDLYVYLPGLSVTVISASENYQSICILADEYLAVDSPTLYNLTQVAYSPLVQMHEPMMTLPKPDAQRLENRMREIMDVLHSGHVYRMQVVRMLFAIFLLDMQDAQDRAIVHRQVPQRIEEIFIDFVKLLPRFFKQHHDIAFYASQLHISPVYLSKVVRKVTRRTVMDYINQYLIMEAAFLLKTSPLTVTQIADQLHFADTASFSKFFSRFIHQSPREFRNAR